VSRRKSLGGHFVVYFFAADDRLKWDFRYCQSVFGEAISMSADDCFSKRIADLQKQLADLDRERANVLAKLE
jgi:hypothetical protein